MKYKKNFIYLWYIITLYIYNNSYFRKINEIKYEFNEQLIDNKYTEEEYYIIEIKETI